ncbi:MAG: hypothetical protein K6C32_00570 [Bacilli bacterium]|nr:hypothetical protein [Bacilli bacterium]
MEEKIAENIKEERGKNAKPLFMQRLAGGLIDVCIIFLVYWGLMNLFMRSSMAYYYNRNETEMSEIRDGYYLESGYGEKVVLTEENENQYSTYIVYTDEDETKYVVVKKDNPSDVEKEKLVTYLNNDKRYQTLYFDSRVIVYGISALAGFISTCTFLMVVPLFNKRRVSIGGLFSEQGLFSLRFESYAHWYHVVLRYFFIYIFEFALPFLFFELYTFFVVPLIFLLVASINHNGRCFHDFVTRTKLIDKRTYSPMVEIED